MKKISSLQRAWCDTLCHASRLEAPHTTAFRVSIDSLLRTLANASEDEVPSIFETGVLWHSIVLQWRGVPSHLLKDAITHLAELVADELGEEHRAFELIRRSLLRLSFSPLVEPESLLDTKLPELPEALEPADRLHASLTPLARRILALHYARRPQDLRRANPRALTRCVGDIEYHLNYLAEAVSTNSPGLFCDYALWARICLEGFGVSTQEFVANLFVIRDVLRGTAWPHVQVEACCSVIHAALETLEQIREAPGSFLNRKQQLSGLAHDYLDALLKSDRHRATKLILDAVDSGVSVRDIYLFVFQRSLYEIGRLWQTHTISVAQEHFSTACTQMIMSQLYKNIFNPRSNGHCFIAASVSGELHEVGVRMVSDFLEMEGWDSYYLGANNPKSSIVETVRLRQPDILGLSATMTFHIPRVRELIEAVREVSSCKIIVGGYPFRVEPKLWKAIGADGSALDAHAAVALVQRLVHESNP